MPDGIRCWVGCLLFVSTAAHAQANWTGKGEVGYVMARGNAETQTGNAKIDVVRESDNTKQNFAVTGLYGESAEAVTASRWDARWQTDWKMTEKSFWFGSIRYEDDNFSGFAYQATATTGAGYVFYDTPGTQLRVQIGAGYRRLQSELLIKDDDDVVIDRIRGDTSADLVGNSQVKYEHSFNDSTKVLNALLLETGQDNTLVSNDLSLQVKMNASLALAVGFSIRNNSNPPVTLQKTDTLTTMNLVYELK
jgi:putative salt-induced outer membrane protein